MQIFDPRLGVWVGVLFSGFFFAKKHQNLAQIIANKRSEQMEDRDPKSISAEIYAGEP